MIGNGLNFPWAYGDYGVPILPGLRMPGISKHDAQQIRY